MNDSSESVDEHGVRRTPQRVTTCGGCGDWLYARELGARENRQDQCAECRLRVEMGLLADLDAASGPT